MARNPSQPKRSQPQASPAAARRQRRALVVDVHTHGVDAPEYRELMRGLPGGARPSTFGQDERSRRGARLFSRVDRAGNLRRRFNDMKKAKADIHVVSHNSLPPFYAAGAAAARKVARAANEGLAAFVAKNPDRFAALGMVPLQHAATAVKELDYLMGPLGLKGVNILSNIQGRDLGEERFWPFWERAEQLGAVVFIHPLGFTHPERLQKFFLANTVGQPLEETLAMLSLIHEGVMERFPKLKIVMAHGGGYLPFYAGRSDSTFYLHPAMRGAAKRPPSEYIKRFHLDSCVFDRRMIEFLADKVGTGHVVLGTDYPFRDWEAVDMIRGSRKLSAEAKERILGLNTARLLGLSV